MNFELTEEQVIFQDAIKGLAQRYLADRALKRAHEPRYPFDVAELLARNRLVGITIPKADGGQGGNLMDAVLAIEQIALVCPRSADVIQSGNFGPFRTFAEYASPAQKEKYFPNLLAGKSIIALGMTEPDAGSAVTDLTTSAKKDGNGYRINGSKVFTSNSLDARLFLIYVRFHEGVDGIGSVLLEKDTDGFVLGEPKTYLNGEEWCPLYFDDVYVEDSSILLGPGGFKQQIAGFNTERIGNAARSLALGQFAFERAKDYALTRKQFGRPLCDFQGMQWKFADMAVKIDAARLLLYRAAVQADQGLPTAFDTSKAKLYCNQTGFELCNESMQIMGATGYSSDSLVEYCFRKSRGWQIAGGSNEMMKNRIAEGIFERRFSQRPPS